MYMVFDKWKLTHNLCITWQTNELMLEQHNTEEKSVIMKKMNAASLLLEAGHLMVLTSLRCRK